MASTQELYLPATSFSQGTFYLCCPLHVVPPLGLSEIRGSTVLPLNTLIVMMIKDLYTRSLRFVVTLFALSQCVSTVSNNCMWDNAVLLLFLGRCGCSSHHIRSPAFFACEEMAVRIVASRPSLAFKAVPKKSFSCRQANPRGVGRGR